MHQIAGAAEAMAFWRKKQEADEKAKVAYVWSQNALLRVAAPTVPGWQRMEAPARPPMLAAIKCIRGEPPEALSLDALLYQPPAAELPTLDQLLERDWTAHFLAKMFASIDRCDAVEIKHQSPSGFSDAGCELTVEGRLREPDMPILLRERHVLAGSRLLVVSAAGSASLHAAHDKLVLAWIEHASLGG